MFELVNDTKRRRGPYCGPTAIGLLTGNPLSRIEQMIRRRRNGGYRDRNGKRIPVRGTGNGEVISVLEALGCTVEPVKVDRLNSPTFGSFVQDMHYVGPMLIEVTDHYMVCEGGMIGDTEHRTPIAIEQYDKKMRRVLRAWKVTAPATPRYTVNDLLTPERPKKPKPDVKLLRHAKALAAVKRWQAKRKRAETAIKRYQKQVRYYERTLGDGA